MSETTPRLGLPLIAAGQAQKHVPVNEALTRLDALVQIAVLSRALASPPADPATGDRYIVADAAAGDWAGQDGRIASYDAGWIFTAPGEGWLVWDIGAEELLVRSGGAWQVFSGGGGGALQNVTLLGLGAEADAANPFVAKLNNALWTTRGAGDGGTGDLRCVMNKEAGANVLSLLLQSASSGRAEIGLVGDEDLLFKVSADGSAWKEALRIDRATGRPAFPQGGVREQLAAARTYYVRTDGSDANDGLTDSAGGAFLTLQKAVDTVAALDISVHDVTIRIGAGTYATATGVVLRSLTGSGTVTILGDAASPADVVLTTNGTVTALDAVINATGITGKWRIKGVRFASTAAGTKVGLQSAIGSYVEFDSVDFGSGLHYQVRASDGGTIRANGDYSISAGAIYHILVGQTGLIRLTDLAVSLSGTPAFTGAFVRADQCAVAVTGGVNFVGAAIGARYLAQLNGVIHTGNSGEQYFPGDSSGSALTGGQYN